MTLDREPLLADRSITGSAWCIRYAALMDEWLGSLFREAAPPGAGLSLVAVGGYGRAELCPASDIDVMVVHDKRVDVGEVATRIWYPIWDSGLKLGHSVCTPRQALQLAADDLEIATALLSARHIAGDPNVTASLSERAHAQWTDGARRWLDQLQRSVEARHANAGEVAFLLEPDLKEGRGGMRDVHALHWAEAARRVLFDNDDAALDRAYRVLLDARVELHRATGRSLNVLTHETQTTVATALGHASADAMLSHLAEAARAIAWMSDDTWRRVRSGLTGPSVRTAGRGRVLGPGVMVRDGEILSEPDDDVGADPWHALQIGVTAAEHDLPIERSTLDRLRCTTTEPPAPWPPDARALFVRLLLAGRPAIPVIEALDYHGAWEPFVPEWTNVRARPQHNPYHRFTVDRHLLETVANTTSSSDTVSRPDLLVLGALLHDLGKGTDRDHTEVGMELAVRVCARIGLPDDETEAVVALVRHHLLLADVASRRDIGDPATVDSVADAVGSVDQLRLLAALTEADAKATGPSAWSSWRAGLVTAIVDRVEARLRGDPLPPSFGLVHDDVIHQLASLADDGHRIVTERDTITVVTTDRPGVFSRVSGVLALRGLDVLEAAAFSTAEGHAVSRFRVVDRLRDETPWTAVAADVERALDGHLAIAARLAERARSHGRQRAAGMSTTPTITVTFDNTGSQDATIIDVATPDALGLLYRITRAFTDLDLDIRSARVQTLGAHVVDAFYVRDRLGRKIVEPSALAEIERALVHAVKEGFDAARGAL